MDAAGLMGINQKYFAFLQDEAEILTLLTLELEVKAGNSCKFFTCRAVRKEAGILSKRLKSWERQLNLCNKLYRDYAEETHEEYLRIAQIISILCLENAKYYPEGSEQSQDWLKLHADFKVYGSCYGKITHKSFISRGFL